MKFVLFLLLAVVTLSPKAQCAPWKQVWETKVPGKPVAAFFHAADGKIYVAAQRSEAKSAVWALSDLGALSTKALLEESGVAGPLRAGGGRLYWAVGEKVISFTPGGERKKEEARVSGEIFDIAVDPKGEVYVAGLRGFFRGEILVDPASSHGLFFLGTDLNWLKDGRAVVSLSSPSPVKICPTSCKWLERAPDGSWITVRGNQVVTVGKKERVLAEGKGIGKPAYVYRRESKDDLLVIPFPDEGMVRAYRSP